MSEIVRLFEHLNQRQVSYVVVGGLAVVLHGHARITADIDLVVALDQANCLNAIESLEQLGYVPRVPVKAKDFADQQKRKEWIDGKGMLVFSMYNPRAPLQLVDLFVDSPCPYPELLQHSELKDLGQTKVRVASIKHLIDMKRSSARPKDLEDIAALEQIKGR